MKILKTALIFFSLCVAVLATAQNSNKKLVYKFDLDREIDAAAKRLVSKNFSEAERQNADYIIMRLNTYGGALDAADSIRTRILNSQIPVIVFIDNQAASAGALISIACDSIYMRAGGNIGAATVVDQSGGVLPDKYQSFMRSMMRATAESHGKKTIEKNGQQTEVWRRNPQIAEAMVDQRIYIPAIIDSGKVLTFTTNEAVANGFCEGTAENVAEVIGKMNIGEYELVEHQPSFVDGIINFLLSPIVQGLLMMLIFGGIYFELQTPGIGFPLAAAAVGAVLYFAPLYIEGLAENWEIIVFAIGIILLLLEIFVIPGWGIAGVSGIILIIVGLTLSMIDNDMFKYNGSLNLSVLVKPLAVTLTALLLSFFGIIYFGKRILASKSSRFSKISLKTELNKDAGFMSAEPTNKHLVGETGVCVTRLCPAGKIMINDEVYTAIAEHGYIECGKSVTITRFETGQLYCEEI